MSDPRLDRLAELIGGSPHNLVARGERAGLRGTHIQESVAVGDILPVEDGQQWMDLGTGGGLPGLVLAMVHPLAHWTLVDATAKKAEAVKGFAEALALENVSVVSARAEVLAHEPDHRGRFDGVVSRALGPLSVVAELSRGFLRPGGTIAAIKGPRWEEERESLRAVLKVLCLREVRSVGVSTAARPTEVVMMRASGPVPTGFPRRDGLPRTQPLGQR